MFHGLLTLLLIQPLDGGVPQAGRVERVDMGHPLGGSDYLLIAEAARHREMRGQSLSCYRIYVFDQGGERHVAFVEARNRVLERETESGRGIVYLPADPDCRSISFVMRSDGRVARVIRSRH